VVRGMLALTALPQAAQEAAFTAVAFSPDFVVIPASGDVPAPWRWGALELLISAVHHAVYATSAIVVFRALDARG